MKQAFSPSADRNKDAILAVLKSELSTNVRVLEIGSGTGQHACFFTEHLHNVVWQPTELASNIAHIASRVASNGNANVLQPWELDVNNHPWPVTEADVCYTCNTFHIIGLDSVESVFKGCRAVLSGGGKLIVYGPFSIQGKYTSSSNQHFDQQLRQQNPASGVRDLTDLDVIAQSHGFDAYRLIEMPSNNFIVVWTLSV